jgi:hypothetical protein
VPVFGIIGQFGPYERVLTAVVPFVLAMALRFAFGSNRLTRALVSASTIWFLVNVLMTPFSERMQREIFSLRNKLR